MGSYDCGFIMQPTGVTCVISEFVEGIIGKNMAIYINDTHILYYNMDVCRSYMLGCSYFIKLDYWVVQGWTEL